MKVTNLSDKQLYLADLKFVPQAQEEGRKGEDRFLGNWEEAMGSYNAAQNAAFRGTTTKASSSTAKMPPRPRLLNWA